MIISNEMRFYANSLKLKQNRKSQLKAIGLSIREEFRGKQRPAAKGRSKPLEKLK
jgi:hypothetical protein